MMNNYGLADKLEGMQIKMNELQNQIIDMIGMLDVVNAELNYFKRLAETNFKSIKEVQKNEQ